MQVTGWLAAVVAGVLVLATLGFYFKIRSEWDTIGHLTVTGSELGKRPPKYNDALNILMIGSDSRAGRNAKIGGYDQGQRSDTVMVVHLAPGRHRVIGMSIPRDTVVPVLACPASNGTAGQQAAPGVVERINATFAAGGPVCLWKTVEQVTGIHIDHFAELDFVGFEKVINSLGGVEVCLPAAVDDPMSGLDLSAGKHRIMGSQAIAFWRTREGLGMNDDPQRIERDQFLMASLVQGIEHSNLLGSPARIFSVLSDIASALTIDQGLGEQGILKIAESMNGISGKSVQFVTAPFEAYPGDPKAELQLAQPQASQLFSAIAHDQTLPKAKQPGSPARPVITPVTDTAAKVSVTVLNGTQTPQLAATTAAGLSSRGFTIAGTGDASGSASSVIEYASSSELAAARALRAQIGSPATLRRDSGLSPGSLTMILGSDFTALGPAPSATPNPRAVKHVAKTYDGISGNANVCKDQAAFAG
jgi:LCP family protein required for cell wall assembly